MNLLDLHLEEAAFVPYKLYRGRVQETLSQLCKEQRHPMGIISLELRLAELQFHPLLLQRWYNLCPTLGDAVAVFPPPYGSVKIVPGNLKLWGYLAKSHLREGFMELRGNSYDKLAGYHILGVKRIREKENFKKEFFSHFNLSGEGREIYFPKKSFPYLTLLAFSHGAKVLGASRLDEKSCLIGTY